MLNSKYQCVGIGIYGDDVREFATQIFSENPIDCQSQTRSTTLPFQASGAPNPEQKRTTPNMTQEGPEQGIPHLYYFSGRFHHYPPSKRDGLDVTSVVFFYGKHTDPGVRHVSK